MRQAPRTRKFALPANPADHDRGRRCQCRRQVVSVGASGRKAADLALQILEHPVLGLLPMVQPPHFVAEVAAVLARLKPDDAQADLADFLEIRHDTVATPQAYITALDLATRYQHHLFDTLYHAVALHTPGAVLVTADERYYAKARSEGRLRLLADFRIG